MTRLSRASTILSMLNSRLRCRRCTRLHGVRRKLQNVRTHASFYSTQPTILRFCKGSCIRPAIMTDSVAGDNSACSILPTLTMHKNWPVFRILNQSKDCENLLVARCAHSAHRKAVVFHAQSFNVFFFALRALTGSPKIDHRLHTQLIQRLQPVDSRLPSPV